MADDECNRKVKAVSEFLQRSCRMRSTNRLNFAHISRCISYPIIHPVDGVECKVFLLSSGSAAEFYIEPMLSCVGDTDVMYHYSNELAVPAWYPPPSQLPTDFENRVKVYEIMDSHQPGYVYLSPSYILAKTHNNAYVIAEYINSPDRSNALNHALYANTSRAAKLHGPAYMFGAEFSQYLPRFGMSPINADTVPCIHCFVWPPQASDWPKRYRNFGWPDSATVDRVIKQGCDVVGIAHRRCKQDEWMSKHQWRLSFSQAEVILLNSWTPVQQMVYHLLRVFVKTELLTENVVDCRADTLSNYHIKTLMLWACEMKPIHWWNNGSTLVNKCIQLLQFLEQWLTGKRGQHYFVSNVHFLDCFDQFTVDTVSILWSDQ